MIHRDRRSPVLSSFFQEEMSMAAPVVRPQGAPIAPVMSEEGQLASFGYKQELRRVIPRFGSFAISFAALSITTGLFLLFPYLLSTGGPAGIWTWPISSIGAIFVALVFAEMATKVPISGYSYQWSSRLSNPHIGWFVGFAAFMGFGIGVAASTYGVAPFFLQFIGIDVTPTSTIIGGTILLLICAVINIVGIRLTIQLTNVMVVTEIVGSVGAAAVLLVLTFLHPIHDVSFLANTNGTGYGFGYIGPFLLVFLVGAWSIAGWESTADLAEETKNAVFTVPRAMLQCIFVVAICGMIILVGFTLAIPDLKATLSAPVPIYYILDHWFGAGGTKLISLFVLASMFGVCLAIPAAATRLVFSMARDNMLPASSYLRKVSPRFGTPHTAVIVITIFSVLFWVIGTVTSPTVLTYAITASAVGYNLVYLATSIIYLLRRDTLKPAWGTFSLGAWSTPVAVISIIWMLFVCGLLTLAPPNWPVGITTAVLLLVAVAWYLLVLRRRLTSGTAGPMVQYRGPESTPILGVPGAHGG
ncbi:MAG: amino acid permease [Aggregatilineales bacterium]